jgi:protein tyrosine phosphatase
MFNTINMMNINEVASGLFISDWHAASDTNTLRKYNIKAVICIETRPKPPEVLQYYERNGIDFMYIYSLDSPTTNLDRYFDITYDFINTHIRNHENVLVHCWAGVSRSATIVLNYIIKELYRKYDTSNVSPMFILQYALDRVVARRPIMPNQGFIKQLEYRALEYAKKANNV